MGNVLEINLTANGGFPQPPPGVRAHVVRARHAECEATTEVRLPATVPARIVRRVRCAGCERYFDTDSVEEVLAHGFNPSGLGARGSGLLRSGSDGARRGLDPSGRLWRLLSLPVAALLVIGGLLAIQGGGDAPFQAAPAAPNLSAPTPAEITGGAAGAANALPADPNAAAEGGRGASAAAGERSKHTELVQGSSFHLVMPKGWERLEAPSGATFAAAAPGAEAEVTLWIEERPKLGFERFVSRSVAQLEALAGSASVVERVAAPTLEGSVVRLAADSPPGEPTYEVVLRAAGPYRYYLATTVEPGASARTLAGAELIGGSFEPEGGV